MEEDNVNKKIDAAFDSLDHIQKAEIRPFLFTRIEARMRDKRSTWGKISSFVGRPVIAFACIFFVLIINASVILFSNNSTSSITQSSSELATADEYSQVSSTLYEFENPKP
jgi:hypothetical protein